MKIPENKYEAKPLDCWGKAKELRMEHYMSIANAKEEGKLLVGGCARTPHPMLAGLGDYVFFGGEPYGASASADHAFSAQAMKTFEGRGYAQEMCAYMRNHVGSMYMDKYLFTGGPFPIMDFIWSNRNCPCGHPKWHVLISEHQGIPMMAIDDEFHHQHSGEMGQRNEYLIGQYLDSIDWLEKVSGRKYDDAKAIEAMKLYYEMECVWGEINVLLSTVPAPVDFKSLMSFVPIQMEMREKPEALEFMKRFRDEVKDRIANKIAAVPNETYRMAMNGIPPWSTLSLFRKLEKYGVVFVTSGAYLIWAKVIYHDDGTITAAKTPEEMGWPEDKNREDMLKTFARWKTELYDHFVVDVDDQVKYTVQLMKFTKIDGAVINIDRGCPPATLGLIDYKIALTEAGIPTVMTEMNHADFRENDEALMMQNIETFLDCQLSE